MVDPENPSEPLEDPKTLAKSMLQQGAEISAIIAETSLSKPTILGIKGALIKASKKLLAAEAKASPSELGEEEISLDLKKEAQITNQAVALARSQQRLKSLNPKSEFLHGEQQPEGNSTSKTLADLELAKYIKQMREDESHPHNGDSSQGMVELQRQLNDLRMEMHKKEIEALTKQSDKLEGQIVELRADLRSSAGSNSDLAVVVKEGKDLLVQALQSAGPIRNYLVPTENFLRPKGEAPVLPPGPPDPQRSKFFVEMEKLGLLTKVRG